MKKIASAVIGFLMFGGIASAQMFDMPIEPVAEPFVSSEDVLLSNQLYTMWSTVFMLEQSQGIDPQFLNLIKIMLNQLGESEGIQG